jgi:hypothetical protein
LVDGGVDKSVLCRETGSIKHVGKNEKRRTGDGIIGTADTSPLRALRTRIIETRMIVCVV